jgi:DNA repair photolyase
MRSVSTRDPSEVFRDFAPRDRVRKGRGSVSNPACRFDAQVHEPFDDGWARDGPEPRRLSTVVHEDHSRSVVTTNQSPDVPFDQSLNPYKGCEHGCVYCFARPTHAYLGHSPGLDFETQIYAKSRAAELLRSKLARPSYRCQVLAVGANTDPYQPVERERRITRSVLEVLAEHHHPVAVVTKSELVVRDIDILADMASERLAHVFVSITTLDPELARRMEPRASSPRRRLRAIEKLTAAGVPVGVLASPMIPGLNDHELERILEASAAAGAKHAGTLLLRLPHELKELFEEWLEAHYPLRRKRVLTLVRACRGGALNVSTFGERMRGTGPHADLIQQRFRVALKRYGLTHGRIELDCSRFVAPGRDPRQLALW